MSERFCTFLKSRSNFEHLWKKDDPHRLCISKITSTKWPLDKQYVKRSPTQSKSAWQHLWDIYSSACIKFSWKKSLLVIRKILGEFVSRSAAHDKYSLLNKDNLMQPIQMQLPKKEETLVQFFLHFWNLDQILRILKSKMTLIGYYFQNHGLRKAWLQKFLKILVSENLLTGNMLKALKHCLNLNSSTFNIFIDQY